jgi:hypothetical protein
MIAQPCQKCLPRVLKTRANWLLKQPVWHCETIFFLAFPLSTPQRAPVRQQQPYWAASESNISERNGFGTFQVTRPVRHVTYSGEQKQKHRLRVETSGGIREECGLAT